MIFYNCCYHYYIIYIIYHCHSVHILYNQTNHRLTFIIYVVIVSCCFTDEQKYPQLHCNK